MLAIPAAGVERVDASGNIQKSFLMLHFVSKFDAKSIWSERIKDFPRHSYPQAGVASPNNTIILFGTSLGLDVGASPDSVWLVEMDTSGAEIGRKTIFESKDARIAGGVYVIDKEPGFIAALTESFNLSEPHSFYDEFHNHNVCTSSNDTVVLTVDDKTHQVTAKTLIPNFAVKQLYRNKEGNIFLAGVSGLICSNANNEARIVVMEDTLSQSSQVGDIIEIEGGGFLIVGSAESTVSSTVFRGIEELAPITEKWFEAERFSATRIRDGLVILVNSQFEEVERFTYEDGVDVTFSVVAPGVSLGTYMLGGAAGSRGFIQEFRIPEGGIDRSNQILH
jgi:hypothetical protein